MLGSFHYECTIRINYTIPDALTTHSEYRLLDATEKGESSGGIHLKIAMTTPEHMKHDGICQSHAMYLQPGVFTWVLLVI
jgi:hypothetical protein